MDGLDMVLRLRYASLAALCAISLGATASAQQNRGTPEQQAACAPDAFRLCSSYIPDPNDVANCLRQKRLELSHSCRSVFDQTDRGSTPNQVRRSSRDSF